MMKILLRLSAALITIPPLAALIVVATFDPNQYKPQLIELGKNFSGREFDIRGDIGLKLSLTPTLVVENVVLGNTDWASHARMLEVARFEGRLRLLPLLRHQISIKNLVLSGANLNLERNAKGEGNWAFGAAQSASATGTVDSESSGLRLFDLERVIIRDSRLEYRIQSNQVQALDVRSMTLQPDSGGLPLRLRADVDYQGEQIDLGARLAPISRLLANEPYELEIRVNTESWRLESSGTIARPLSGNGIDLEFEVSAAADRILPDSLEQSRALGQQLRASGRLADARGAYQLSDVEIKLGESQLTANVAVDLSAERPQVSAEITSSYLDLSPASEVRAATSSPAPTQGRLLSTMPLPLSWLDLADLKLLANVGRLKLGRTTLETMRLVGTIDNRQLEVTKLTALIEQGTLQSTLRLDARDNIPQVDYSLNLDNVSMTPLVSAEVANKFRGGRVALALEFSAQGLSAAELAADATGNFRLELNEVDIAHGAAGAVSGDLLLNAFTLLNPLARPNQNELIECAVFRFPIQDGEMSAKSGIGIQTRRLNILGGGGINLATETIDIGVNPKPREGIGLNLAGFADFVRIGGTLSKPQPTTDGAGAALAGTKIGAAVATGGLSLLAEGLLDRADGDLDVCAIASGTARLPGDNGSTVLGRAADKTGDALERAGRAVQGTFKRLFGD